MKKLIIATAVSASLFGAGAVHAQESSVLSDWQDNVYFQLKVGLTDLGLSDDATTVTGVAGLKTPALHHMLSFEADATFTIADAEYTHRSGNVSTDVEASAYSLGGYAVLSYDQLPIDNLVPYARVGVAYSKFEVSASNPYARVSADDSEFDVGLTAGLRYQITDSFGIVADYHTVSELDTFNLGAHFSF